METLHKTKYPCGFEHTVFFKSSWHEVLSFKMDTEMKPCPMHGFKCQGKK